MQGKIAILGSQDFVMPYSALGLDSFAVGQDEGEIVQTAQKIVDEKYVMVIVAETIAEKTQTVFEKFNNRITPCVLVMPFTTESQGFATKNLSKLLKAATGIDILNS